MLERTCYSNGSEFREYLTLVSQDKRLHQGHTVRNSLLRGKKALPRIQWASGLRKKPPSTRPQGTWPFAEHLHSTRLSHI